MGKKSESSLADQKVFKLKTILNFTGRSVLDRCAKIAEFFGGVIFLYYLCVNKLKAYETIYQRNQVGNIKRATF